MKKKKLIQLIEQYIQKKGYLFMPNGRYGMEAYLIDEDGFKGPDRIPDYVVPATFSSEAYRAFNERLLSNGIRLQDLDAYSEFAEKLLEGIDTRFGEGWTLKPWDFIEMIRAGCEPEEYYLLPPDFDFNHFETLLEDALSEGYTETYWDDLDEEDVDYWISLFEDFAIEE